MKIKKEIYDTLVRKDKNVQKEYERYVQEHIIEHYENRFKHWKILWKLNWHYRVVKKKEPLLYWDMDNGTEHNSIPIIEKKENLSVKTIEHAPELKITKIINGGTYIELKWEPLKDVFCYNVYYSTDKVKYKFTSKVTDASCRIEKLECDTRYFIKIRYSYNGKNYKDNLSITDIKTRKLNAYEEIFGTKTICVNTAESVDKPIMSAMNMAKGLMKYDVVSFDIFDTLILRPFAKPYDLFILVGHKLDIMDFCELRIKAENKAREYAKMTRGNSEVTIYDIYKIIENETGVPMSIGIKTEFQVEQDLCYANPYMQRVYELVKYQGKKIVICSDMYYPKEMMEQLLNKCGYFGYEDVIVSCDYNCTKRNGGLYGLLKEKYDNLVHIGDNEISDIQMAEKAGIANVYYPNVNKKGNKYRAENMSYLVGSAYKGIVNAHLHNGTKEYTPYYEMGFTYAGLYVFGFCQWIHKILMEQGIKKVLFLAREGDIYQKVFDLCYDDIKTEYVLWSRVPVAKTIVEKNRHPFLLQLVHHKANAIYKSKITTLFERIGIGLLLQYLPEYRINEEEYLTPDNEKVIERLMIEHWDEICQCYENDKNSVKEYIKTVIGNDKEVAVVDVGWSGNNVLQIKYLVEKEFKFDCKVKCLLAATRNVNDTYMAGMMQDSQVDTYIFSNMYNKFLHDFHQETNNKLNSFFFEIMTQSATPTFLGFEEDKFLFDIPEIENYQYDKQIHAGIIDFAKIYKHTFEKYPYMYNISGHDAYMPFRLMVSDLSYIKKWFSDFVFGRDLCATQEKAIMETVGEVIEKAGL